jgi:hypothetical protein
LSFFSNVLDLLAFNIAGLFSKPKLMRLILFCIILLLSIALVAQTPRTISYQAVVRNNKNQLITDREIGVMISILRESPEGETVFSEVYPSISTNSNGLITLEIGTGEPVLEKFEAIEWSIGPYFIRVEIDPADGSGYSITGTSQILAVPYALHAASAETLTGSFPYNNLSGKPDLSVYATRNMQNQKITNLANPTHAQDAATKDYVDLQQDTRWVGEAGTTAHISRTGNVGIGIVAPKALLHVHGTGLGSGNVLFTGGFKEYAGIPPASGTGTRMMWYPDKAAFRAGYVEDVNWNRDSIGNYSIAMGYNPKAKGWFSTAIGFGCNATGYFSTALGVETTASGGSAFATGYGTIASGVESTATGSMTIASGRYSTSMGYRAKAFGDYSFAIHLSSSTATLVEVPANTFRITGAAAIGGNVAWTNFSDRRLKKEIVAIGSENNLSKILMLNAVRYRWTEHDQLLNLGFIAQDVLDIVPESVRYDEHNDIYSMEYTALIPVLVEGMKEQQEIIEKLQKNIEQLKQENYNLRASVEELEELKADVERIKEMFLVKE